MTQIPAASQQLRVESTFLVRNPCGQVGSVADLLRDLNRSDVQSCRTLLTRVRRRHDLFAAILLASPSLAKTITMIVDGQHAKKDSQIRRAALASIKYAIRMETRPTPFGLFAGVSTGSFDTVAKIERHVHAEPRVVMDSVWIDRLVNRISAIPSITDDLKVRTHQALVARDGRVCLDYPSACGASTGQTQRAAVSTRASAPVAAALAAAKNPLPRRQLIAAMLETFPNAAPDAVSSMVDDLISSELLVSELQQPLDRTDDLYRLLRLLECPARTSPPARQMRDTLLALDTARHLFEESASSEEQLTHLQLLLRQAKAVEDYDTPLHVDSSVGMQVRLPEEVGHEIESLAQVLFQISPERLGFRGLRGYHADFLERFGTDRLVPLLELVDSRQSLGPPAGYNNPASEHGRPSASWEEPESIERRRTITRLYSEAMLIGSQEVILDGLALSALSSPTAQDLPRQPSSELYVHVVAATEDTLTAGDFRVVLSHNPGSHTAGATSARFWDLLDVDRSKATDADAAPTRPGLRTVDLAYKPVSDRAANLAHTGQPGVERISCGVFDSDNHEELRLADIAVGATLERLYAVHLPTGTEIVPVVSNMVSAPAQAPNPIRLLFEIGHEGVRLWEPWNWGPLADAPFLPRVRFQRSILAPAMWRPDDLLASVDDPEAWSAAILRWRGRWNVPQHVLLVTNDHRLLVDLKNHWHCEVVREELRRSSEQVFTEIPGAAQGWADGDVRGHLTEYVVNIKATQATPRPQVPASYIVQRPWQRTAQDWLYLKISLPAAMDKFIIDRLPGLIDSAQQMGASDWFFIRYTDVTGYHLRVRIRTNTPECWARSAVRCLSELDDLQLAGHTSSHSIERWDPELERYAGVAARSAVEAIFHTDSRAAVNLLRIGREYGLSLELLTAASLTSMANSFAPLRGVDSNGDAEGNPANRWLGMTGDRRSLPPGYRQKPKYWQQLIDPAGGWRGLRQLPGGEDAMGVLGDRDTAVSQLAVHLAASDGAQTFSSARVIGSLMHMTCNRLVGGDGEAEIFGLARGAVQDNARRQEAHQ